MQSFLAIEKNIQKKQRKSKKWRIVLYIFMIFWNSTFIPILYSPKGIQLVDILGISEVLIVDVLVVLSVFIFAYRIDRIIREENEIIEVATKNQVDEWFSKNKKLINFSSLVTLVSKKITKYPWGVINKDDHYQIIFIDFSKKNALVILTVQKLEIKQYDEADTIEKLIYKIKKWAKITQMPIAKQLMASDRFFNN